MTRILFYVLESPEERARQYFVCRLVRKIYHMGHRVHIHTGNDDLTRQLDTLLWTFEDEAFLPHSTQPEDVDSPITLHAQHLPTHHDEVLINLAHDLPSAFGRFTQLAEIIGGPPEARAAGRERYRYFRQRGYPLEHHTISSP